MKPVDDGFVVIDLLGRPRTDVVDWLQAEEFLDELGMSHRLDHYPESLSGGERQRVAIARALVNSPRLLLADEPTGNLDSESGQRIMNLLDELHQAGSTLVMVTHDADYAARAGRRLHMKDGHIESDQDHSA